MSGVAEKVETADFIEAALAAFADGKPDTPVELSPGIYVRAGYVLQAFAPEVCERLVFAAGGWHSIRSELVERVCEYVGAATA